MEVLLIRHGKTQGNLEKRYVGSTDEPLCASGAAQLREQAACYPAAQRLVVSPLLRCSESRPGPAAEVLPRPAGVQFWGL